MKSLLFIFQSSPYANYKSQEAIDTLLLGASLDYQVSLLFLGQGIFHLIKHDTQGLLRKNLNKILRALESLDIKKLFVIQDDLENFNFQPEEISLHYHKISFTQLRKLLDDNEIIITV